MLFNVSATVEKPPFDTPFEAPEAPFGEPLTELYFNVSATVKKYPFILIKDRALTLIFNFNMLLNSGEEKIRDFAQCCIAENLHCVLNDIIINADMIYYSMCAKEPKIAKKIEHLLWLDNDLSIDDIHYYFPNNNQLYENYEEFVKTSQKEINPKFRSYTFVTAGELFFIEKKLQEYFVNVKRLASLNCIELEEALNDKKEYTAFLEVVKPITDVLELVIAGNDELLELNTPTTYKQGKNIVSRKDILEVKTSRGVEIKL